jgi:hypothetical protein
MDIEWWAKIATIVGGLSTGFAALVVIATAIIYGLQLRAIRRANELESVLIVLRYIEDPQLRRARWFVYLHPELLRDLPDLPIELGWPQINQNVIEFGKKVGNKEIDLYQIDLVINTLNDIAYLINTKHIPSSIVTDFLSHTFHRCVHLLGDYIEYRKKHPLPPAKAESRYAYHLEKLIQRLDNN